jgi:arginyl-tRNA synthetase
MNLFAQLHDYIHRFVITDSVGFTFSKDKIPQHLLDAVTVEFPKDPTHGDLSTNVAMVLAKHLKKNPRELAEEMLDTLTKFKGMKSAEIAGPGFINMHFEPSFWQAELHTILNAQTAYGTSAIGDGKRVNIEFVSANPTGPLHIGHARGAVIGDALANLLTKASYDVVKEYYINDAGNQINVLAESLYVRYMQLYGQDAEIQQGMYPGEYLIDAARAMKEDMGGSLLGEEAEDWREEVRLFAVEKMLELIRHDLALLGVHHDVFTSELHLQEEHYVENSIETLNALGLIYRGVLEAPKGKEPPEDWEPQEQTLFKSTEFGDDSDRPVIKSDGNYTYFAGDIAYTKHKIERGFDTLIMILGADHGGYVSRMHALVQAFSEGRTQLKIQLCQLVKLLDGGQPVKMSKRAGNFVLVSDVVQAVGKDALRFHMLLRKAEQAVDFDFQKVTEQSKDNPVFYVQYAHARCQSVLRTARQDNPEAYSDSQYPEKIDVSVLSSEKELNLIKTLASFPRAVEQAAIAYEPHRIAYFLQELASELHGLWHVGSGDAQMRFIVEGNTSLTSARLALARCVVSVIASGLHILGVEPIDEMR